MENNKISEEFLTQEEQIEEDDENYLVTYKDMFILFCSFITVLYGMSSL